MATITITKMVNGWLLRLQPTIQQLHHLKLNGNFQVQNNGWIQNQLPAGSKTRSSTPTPAQPEAPTPALAISLKNTTPAEPKPEQPTPPSGDLPKIRQLTVR